MERKQYQRISARELVAKCEASVEGLADTGPVLIIVRHVAELWSLLATGAVPEGEEQSWEGEVNKGCLVVHLLMSIPTDSHRML